jgi:hypothetical protein
MEEDTDTKNSTQDSCDGNAMACPLFMEGLPTNFAHHPQLAALASLLEEVDDAHEEEEEEVDTNEDTYRHLDSSNSIRVPSPIFGLNMSGGGKVKRTKGRQQRNTKSSPYAVERKKKPSSSSSPASASLGEAQLFMKMWKL